MIKYKINNRRIGNRLRAEVEKLVDMWLEDILDMGYYYEDISNNLFNELEENIRRKRK